MLVAYLVAHTTTRDDKLQDPVLASYGFKEASFDNKETPADQALTDPLPIPAPKPPPKKKRLRQGGTSF